MADLLIKPPTLRLIALPTHWRFVENRIDLSVLTELTDQDLKDLGVLLGDRRKVLGAIRDPGNASAAVTALQPALAIWVTSPAF